MATNRPRRPSGPLLIAASAIAAIFLLAHVLLAAFSPLPPPWASALGGVGAVCANPSGKQAWLTADSQAPDTTDIEIGNSDETDARVLRQEPATILPGNFDSLLALTGDASRLAYVTASSLMLDDAHLWYIDVATPIRRTKLADVATGLWLVQPVWSPDKKRLAYARVSDVAARQNKTQVELWVAQVGGRPTRVGTLPDLPLENLKGDRRASLCWAADNRTLVVQNLTPDAVAGLATPATQSTAQPVSAQSLSTSLSSRNAVVATGASTVAVATGGSSLDTTEEGATTASAPAVPSASRSAGASTSVASTAPPRSSAAAPTAAPTAAASQALQQVEIDTTTGQHRTVTQPPEPPPPPRPDRSQITTAGTACSVAALMQMDPRWRWQIMQSGGDSIGSYGCALTSTTMLLNYYGLSMTPDQLSACLHSDADLLLWWNVPHCASGAVRFVNEYDFSWQRLDAVLATGTPAILGFLGGPAGMHWVVVTGGGGGGDGSSYAVIDPWDATTDKTVQFFVGRGYKPSWIVEYQGPGNPCATRLIVVPGQPVVAVTAPAGGRATPPPRAVAVATPPVAGAPVPPNKPLLAVSPGPTATPHPLATIAPVVTHVAEAWRTPAGGAKAPPAGSPPAPLPR